MPPVLAKLVNVGDGQQMDLTFGALPGPNLHIYASTLPGVRGGECPVSSSNPYIYRLNIGNTLDTVAFPGLPLLGRVSTAVRTPIYVTAEDDTGAANEQICWWLCMDLGTLGLHDHLEQWESALRDILLDNKPALDAALQIFLNSDHWPNGHGPAGVKRILVGSPAVEANNYQPVIAVNVDRFQEDLYFGRPYTDAMPLNGEIICIMLHQSQSEMPISALRAVMMAAKDIINTGNFLEIKLDCGLTVTASHCVSGNVQEEWIETEAFTGYQCLGTLQVSGELSIAMIGGIGMAVGKDIPLSGVLNGS
jgi:hypothetical protein